MRPSLPRSSVNAIKTKLNSAVSAKDPQAVAVAVDLPSLTSESVAGAPTRPADGAGSQQHGEHLKIDGVDWSNVLNPLLDAHLAIQSVGASCVIFLWYNLITCT